MGVLVITGTGTGVGKTIVTAAVAACALGAGRTAAVLKPAQTGVRRGESGDVDDVRRLVGPVTTRELARYPDPLAPATAAARVGAAGVGTEEIAEAVRELDGDHDTVLVEGAGGLLVRLDTAGGTVADAAGAVAAPVLVVARAGLGTLNDTALTVEALRVRGLACLGVVIGEWRAEPDLAAEHNLRDLPEVAAAPLLGVLPSGAGGLPPEEFRARAPGWLRPELGGTADDPATTVGRLHGAGAAR
ncbi:dethiobiotin synthetase [Actinoalloteichus hoggarensis]|uniref:ATP-dependent dethiobiotin synthetase BioD n=1 Tax=Actinoalloteichus hoggarensis TaxID=1470176 RepID=A0A221W113_9PSEU|nr:dethiobiotin synthase [Actinoalloteichus hoggarensis]ASO19476.1 ATP-dependent dethiobiotin synthetase BioD [Actinoalloteichus hoggarensis]MBB5919818.1 dethiobiotin synthetase [Actinoalloteichus hoggarensis]